MIELEVRVHFEARVERLDGVPVTPVAVVQEPDTVPKTGVLQSKSAATAASSTTAATAAATVSGGGESCCTYTPRPGFGEVYIYKVYSTQLE